MDRKNQNNSGGSYADRLARKMKGEEEEEQQSNSNDGIKDKTSASSSSLPGGGEQRGGTAAAADSYASRLARKMQQDKQSVQEDTVNNDNRRDTTSNNDNNNNGSIQKDRTTPRSAFAEGGTTGSSYASRLAHKMKQEQKQSNNKSQQQQQEQQVNSSSNNGENRGKTAAVSSSSAAAAGDNSYANRLARKMGQDKQQQQQQDGYEDAEQDTDDETHNNENTYLSSRNSITLSNGAPDLSTRRSSDATTTTNSSDIKVSMRSQGQDYGEEEEELMDDDDEMQQPGIYQSQERLPGAARNIRRIITTEENNHHNNEGIIQAEVRASLEEEPDIVAYVVDEDDENYKQQQKQKEENHKKKVRTGLILIFIALILIIIVGITIGVVVPKAVEDNGDTKEKATPFKPEYPAVAVISFSLDDCDLYDSWYMLRCKDNRALDGCKGLRKVVSFADTDGACNKRIAQLENDGNVYDNSMLKRTYMSISNYPGDDDVNSTYCSGTFEMDVINDSANMLTTKGNFSNSKLLCNNGEIIAYLGIRDDTPQGDDDKYFLYYATNTTIDEVDDKSYFYSMSALLENEKGGEYCLDLFSLMAKLQSDLNSSSSTSESLALKKSCGFDNTIYGTIFGLPAVAGIHFSLDNCVLHHSWLLDLSPGGQHAMGFSGLLNFVKYTDYNFRCTDEFANLVHDDYNGDGTYPTSHWKSSSLLVNSNSDDEMDTCSGSYKWEFTGRFDNYAGSFTNGKLLCNNGHIMSYIGETGATGNDYYIYYSTKTQSFDVNEMTDFHKLSTSFDYKAGEYCLDLYSLMSKLFVDLRSSSPPSSENLATLSCGQPRSSLNEGNANVNSTPSPFATQNPTPSPIATQTPTIGGSSNGISKENFILGETAGYPAVAGFHFTPNSICFLHHSWQMYLCSNGNYNCYGLNHYLSFADSNSECSNEFVNVYGDGGGAMDGIYHNFNFKSTSMSIYKKNETTCDGFYVWAFANDAFDDYMSPLTNAKLLCNDGKIVSFLGQTMSGEDNEYYIHYATNTSNDDVNEITSFNSLSENFESKTGEYCMGLYDLMTKLLGELSSSPGALNGLPCGWT